MATEREQLMHRARCWINKNQCPLPLDLAVEMMGEGLDVQTIEETMLEDREDG